MTPSLPVYYGASSVQAPVQQFEGVHSFKELVEQVLFVPVKLPVTRAEYDRFKQQCDEEQDKEKRALLKAEFFRYKNTQSLIAGVFTESGVKRRMENVTACNLIIIDIDKHEDAARLLSRKASIGADLSARFFAHHTISSRPDSLRVRLIVDAATFPPELYERAACCVCDRLGLSAPNPESRSPVQVMFCPGQFRDDDASPVCTMMLSGDPLPVSAFRNHPVSRGNGVTLSEEDFVKDWTDTCLDYLPIPAVTLEITRSMLDKLDPDMDREQWYRIGAALKHQHSASKEAFTLWDEWSATGVKYGGENEMRAVWRSFRGEKIKPVTIRSLIKMARKAGWEPDKKTTDSTFDIFKNRISEAPSPGALTEIIKEVARHPLLTPVLEEALMGAAANRTKVLGFSVTPQTFKKELREAHSQIKEDRKANITSPDWCKTVVYAKGIHAFIDWEDMLPVKPEAFNLAHLKACKDAGVVLPATQHVLMDVGVPVVHDIGYDPSSGQRFYIYKNARYLNSYQPTYFKEDEEFASEAFEIARFHLHNVMASDARTAELMLSWMAWIVQNPGKKIKWAIFLTGKQGIGKSVIGAWFNAVLGYSNVNLVSMEKLGQGYSDWIKGYQILICEEVNVSGKRIEIMDKIKPLVTEARVGITGKYVASSTIDNFVNMLLLSNHTAGLSLTEDDRRFFVVCAKAQSWQQVQKDFGEDYYKKVYSLAEDPKMGAGLRWALLHFKDFHPEFNPDGNAPVTADREVVVEAGGNEIRKGLQHLFESEESPWIRSDIVVSPRTLRPLRELCSRSISIHMVADELKKLGFIKLPSSPMVFDKREATWVHESWDRGLLGDPAKALRDRVGADGKFEEI